jgi:glycosyltransferase involved in cell wall biosynthesis
MQVPIENGNGSLSTPEQETTEPRNGHARRNGTALAHAARPHTLNRLGAALEAPPAPNGHHAEADRNGHHTEPDDRPALALFCYDDPETAPVRFAAKAAGALASRGVAVHLFTRKGFEPGASGVSMHVLGEGEDGDLLDRVQEFTHRACNAFLREFQGATAPVTLMGCEWSAAQTLSILRGIKNLNTVLALNSLERQRSDMTSELSKKIEEIELTGLREARHVLTLEPATAEVVKYWVPACVDRTVCLRPVFPTHRFQRQLDPGAVKARYQVGPVDPMILYVGDLNDRYGPDLLIKAMPAVLKNHPQARLVIVGDGGDYWPLRVYARYLLLEHAVRLPGHVEGDALDELIQAADVIAVPSREATPWWPVLAGWAARRPVVATHNAAPGLVEHEQDAVLFYPNVPSCVWGIERVLYDAELGREMSAKGGAKLEERFGYGAVAAQLKELMGVPQASH